MGPEMSADGIKVELRDGIRILTLANPPLNELAPGLRDSLMQAIADRGPDCRGIVLAAEGPNFAGHLPLSPDPAAPTLAELCRTVADAKEVATEVEKKKAMGAAVLIGAGGGLWRESAVQGK